MITQTFICLGTTTTQSEFRGLYPARVGTPEEERTSVKHGKKFPTTNYNAEKLNAQIDNDFNCIINLEMYFIPLNNFLYKFNG